MRIGSLFSGYGGLEQGVQSVLGGTVAWHSEIDRGACKILAHRYPDVPNLGDITSVDWTQVEPVDVLTGGSPCQDVSAAGKRAGMRAGTRSGLWASMCDAIDIIRPGLVVWENVRGALSAGADSAVEPCPICVGDERDTHLRALGRVVGDLAELGYVGRWTGLRAADVGAPHGRFRVFVVAWPAANARGEVSELWPGLRADEPRRLRGARPDDGGAPAGHADVPRLEGRLAGRGSDERPAGSTGLGSVAYPGRIRGERRRVNGELAGSAGAGQADRGERERDGDAADDRGSVAWGQYAPAVRRWERCLGRLAPSPTEVGAKGAHRLSARAVEFMMGLPDGWVTDVPGLSRKEMLHALGNGVVPQQAAHALRLLLPDVARAAA